MISFIAKSSLSCTKGEAIIEYLFMRTSVVEHDGVGLRGGLPEL